MLHNRRRYHTGSVVAQHKKDRVPAAGSSADTTSSLSSSTSNENNHLIVGENIRILSLNVEGISMSKCEYLSKLLRKHNVDIALLQETHLTDNSQPSRYNINGYSVINRQNHDKYGVITYARKPDLVTDLGGKTDDHGTQTTTIKIGKTEITNIYKPPNINWTNPPLTTVNHPAIIAEDFISHHNEWGYPKSDQAGEKLSQWYTLSNLSLVYNPKDKGTFHSGAGAKIIPLTLCLSQRTAATDQHQQQEKLC